MRDEQVEQRGMLIAFEGPDGSGKTTQRKLLTDWLRDRGEQVVVTKWNSSPRFKPVIKARKATRSLTPIEFAALHAADFRYRYENDIVPAILQGKVVVADRYAFTGLARDAARGLDREWSRKLYEPLVWPHVVFYLSVSADTCVQRIGATRQPKFYEAGQDVSGLADPFQSFDVFTRKVIVEYEQLSREFPFVAVNAEQGIYEQHRFIRHFSEELLEIHRQRFMPAMAIR